MSKYAKLLAALAVGFLLVSCGTVRETNDTAGPPPEIPVASAVTTSSLLVQDSGVDIYVTAIDDYAAEANAVIDIHTDENVYTAFLTTVTADARGRFTQHNIPRGAYNIYFYAAAPGKTQSPPVSMPNPYRL
jgi:ABC-type glycerol-3-phosphate transport system substrate-binding protein